MNSNEPIFIESALLVIKYVTLICFAMAVTSVTSLTKQTSLRKVLLIYFRL